jgi:hypothetical protein
MANQTGMDPGMIATMLTAIGKAMNPQTAPIDEMVRNFYGAKDIMQMIQQKGVKATIGENNDVKLNFPEGAFEVPAQGVPGGSVENMKRSLLGVQPQATIGPQAPQPSMPTQQKDIINPFRVTSQGSLRT